MDIQTADQQERFAALLERQFPFGRENHKENGLNWCISVPDEYRFVLCSNIDKQSVETLWRGFVNRRIRHREPNSFHLPDDMYGS